MSAGQLLLTLWDLAHRASKLTQLIRSNCELFALLVQEKTGEAKNEKFCEDFKTLADVLVQDMVRYEIERHFPQLKGCIFGEESSKLAGSCGTEFEVCVGDDRSVLEDTIHRLLSSNHASAARLLTETVYTTVQGEELINLPTEFSDIPIRNWAVWIDPIDGTNVYVKTPANSQPAEDSQTDIVRFHLPCVTVLIGVFDIDTGRPVMSVIDQPFYRFVQDENRWLNRSFWAFAYNETALHCQIAMSNQNRREDVVLIQSSDPLAEVLGANGYRISYATGAGYKVLCVALGLADLYITRSGTTYLWDTCAPHALLKSLGGGILHSNLFLASLSEKPCCDMSALVQQCELTYKVKTDVHSKSIEPYSNAGGLIAYRSVDRLEKLHKILANGGFSFSDDVK